MRLIKVTVLLVLCITSLWAEFDPSRFNFGTDWDYLTNKQSGSVASAVDYVTVWVVESAINTHVKNMLSFCKKENKTPVLYAYLIAKVSGLGDQNEGGSLGVNGAGWLRDNISKMKSTYEEYSKQVANTFGVSKPIVWIMEPDFYQYCDGGGELNYGEAAGYMKDLVNAISKNLPNAVFSFDVSPWCGDINGYVSAFDMSQFSFMCNTGGETSGGSSKIRDKDIVLWSQAYNTANKCIIADCGYSVGGASTGHTASWDDLNNLKNRMRDGVVAITQKNPRDDWGNTILSLKSSLSSESTNCGSLNFDKKYSLTIPASSGGDVTISPEALSYDSGSIVTVTAKPTSGFKLSGWTGDATGNTLTLSLKMTKDMTIKANFVDVNAKSQYSLTVDVSGSGVVLLDPEQVLYDSGTTVKLEAFIVDDGSFTTWGGDTTCTVNPLILLIDGNKNITASFTGSNINTVNLLKNGSFNDGEAEWEFGAYENSSAEGSVEEGGFKVNLETSGTATWEIQLAQSGVSLEKGKRYTFSFYGHAESATSIVANIGMPEDPYTSYSKVRPVKFTTENKIYSYNFTMTSESTSEARIEFNAGKCTASWFVDEVILKEAITVGPSSILPQVRPTSNSITSNGNERVVVAWYDHAGRLLHKISGDHSVLSAKPHLRFTGSAIAVVQIGSSRTVHKTINFAR